MISNQHPELAERSAFLSYLTEVAAGYCWPYRSLYKSLIICVGEQKFHVIFALKRESSRERKFHGAKVPESEIPPMELSLPGANVRANEGAIIQENLRK